MDMSTCMLFIFMLMFMSMLMLMLMFMFMFMFMLMFMSVTSYELGGAGRAPAHPADGLLLHRGVPPVARHKAKLVGSD